MNISVKEEVTLVTLQNTPSRISFVSEILEAIAKLSVNVDMISQEPPQGEISSLSFTISDDDLVKVLVLASSLRENYPQLKPIISSENCKITVSDEAMRTKPGVAATFFHSLAELEPDIRIITTSETEISILVTKAHSGHVIAKLQETFIS